MKADIEREKMCFILELRKITASNMESIYNESYIGFVIIKVQKRRLTEKKFHKDSIGSLRPSHPKTKEKQPLST